MCCRQSGQPGQRMLSPTTTVLHRTAPSLSSSRRSGRQSCFTWSMKTSENWPCQQMKAASLCTVPTWIEMRSASPACWWMRWAISATFWLGSMVCTSAWEKVAMSSAEKPQQPPSSRTVLGWCLLRAILSISPLSSPMFIIQLSLQNRLISQRIAWGCPAGVEQSTNCSSLFSTSSADLKASSYFLQSLRNSLLSLKGIIIVKGSLPEVADVLLLDLGELAGQPREVALCGRAAGLQEDVLKFDEDLFLLGFAFDLEGAEAAQLSALLPNTALPILSSITELQPSDSLSSLSCSSSFTSSCCLGRTSAASLLPSFGRSNSARSSTYSSSSSSATDFDGSVFSCAVSLFSSLAQSLARTYGFGSTSSTLVDSRICRKGRKRVVLSLASLSRTVLIRESYLLQPHDVLLGNALAEPVFLEEAIDQRVEHFSVESVHCFSVFVEFLLLAVAAHRIIKEKRIWRIPFQSLSLCPALQARKPLLLMLHCNSMLTVLLLMVTYCLCWKLQPTLSAALQASLPSNLTDFQTAYNANRDELIIYGGKTGNQYSKRTYIVSLANATVSTLQNESSIRYQACIISVNATLYLFGGYKVGANQTQEKSGEFWSLDLDTYKWSILHSGLEPYRFCEMVERNGTLLIFGASFDGVLDVFSFTPQTNNFQNLTVQFYGSCSFSSMLWDGSTVPLTLPIELCPRTFPNLTLAVSPRFPTNNISFIDLMETGSQSMRFLQTEDHIYSYHFNAVNQSISLRYSSPVDKEAGSIFTKSVRFGGWNIYCNLNTQTRSFYLTFMQKSKAGALRVTSRTPHYYSSLWPSFNTSALFSIAIISPSSSPSILLLQHSSLTAYLLQSNVFEGTITPPGVLNSLFGLNQCSSGWTGRNCTVPACPNSLQVNGNNNISVLRLECSGHGECGEKGCKCDPLWGGPDCSVYLRQSCKGTLLANFPLNNCECMDSKRGGNDCTAVFCPGDCFGHGKCTAGVCSCGSNYYGADCSTMIVSFPK